MTGTPWPLRLRYKISGRQFWRGSASATTFHGKDDFFSRMYGAALTILCWTLHNPLSPTAMPSRRRILFVDDEPSIRLTLPPILEQHGFEVKAAANVAEAVAQIK